MTVHLEGPPPGDGLPEVDVARLRAWGEAMLAAVGRPDAELSLCLVDDATVAELNQRWRGRKGPTDVLSFSLLEGEHAERRGPLLGDVVIGLGVAARQAAEREVPLPEELARLLIHGVLHLVGHDHQSAPEARAMRAEEERLWRAALREGALSP